MDAKMSNRIKFSILICTLIERTALLEQLLSRLRPQRTDLVEKINWCKDNREECVEIGKRAKQWFQKNCLPQHLNKWIELWVS